jgi:hypothetical protein
MDVPITVWFSLCILSFGLGFDSHKERAHCYRILSKGPHHWLAAMRMKGISLYELAIMFYFI